MTAPAPLTVTHFPGAGDSDLGFDDIKVRDEWNEALDKRLATATFSERAAIPAYNESVDSDQKLVIADRSHVLRVVAPAGAGKTQTIVNRMLTLVREGVRPDRILLLTFDRNAADSARSKMAECLRGANAQVPLRISTLNAFGYSILREHFPAEALNVLDDNSKSAIIRSLLQRLATVSAERHAELPPYVRRAFYLELFSLLKNELLDPRELDAAAAAEYLISARAAEPFFQLGQSAEARRRVLQALLWLFRHYDDQLRNLERIDFDDQKLRTWSCLKAGPRLLETLQSRFTEVIVDEFQDINRLDFELIRQIAGKSRLVVTGDDDQAIYGFRGCSADYIINLAERLDAPITALELKTNYRCPANIVTHAAKLISHNVHRISKSPIAYRPASATIKVLNAGTASVEARNIIRAIKRSKREVPSLGYGDFAVLFRTNAQSLPLQIELILAGIPYSVRPEDNVVENKTLEDLLAILSLREALRLRTAPIARHCAQAVKGYFRYVPPQDLSAIERVFERSPGFFEALQDGSLYRVFHKAESSAFELRMREFAQAPRLLDALLVLSKHFNGLRGMVGSIEDVVDNQVPLGELFELAAAFKGNAPEFIRTLASALSRAREQNAGDAGDQGVALRTFFKSKGLQWHTVFILGCNEGIVPDARAPIEEERRLFYVGMTRAQEHLVVSYLKRSCGSKVERSRFLYEAGLIDAD
jgi:DNA helicase-2/ATP-dependent DNA helicase PcrA